MGTSSKSMGYFPARHFSTSQQESVGLNICPHMFFNRTNLVGECWWISPCRIGSTKIKQTGQTRTNKNVTICDLDSIAYIQTLTTHQPRALEISPHRCDTAKTRALWRQTNGLRFALSAEGKSADFCPQTNRSRQRNGPDEPLESSFDVYESSWNC